VAGGPPRPWEAIGRWAGPEARSHDEEEDRRGVTGSEEEENRGGRRRYRGRTLPRDGSRGRRTLMIKPETVPNQ
jgi:hypothetical protein